jgi:PAS domain S-box-containing protein
MASSPVKSSPPSSWNILAAIVDSSDDAIISKDLKGNITSWNISAERLFGYRADEIIGQSIMSLIPLELRGDEAQILAKIKAGERIDHFQTVRVKKSGERMEVSLTISPVKDERGVIVGAAKILRDITRQKKLEAMVHTSERLASVGRLAASVAHEINNPLEAVTNYVYLAKQQPDLPPKIKQYLDSADAALARVAHIAQQTLGFYRENFQPTKLVISKIIDDVLAIYERKLKYKRLDVDRRIDSGLTLSGFEGEMKQMLSNLVTNACDACQDGGRIIIAARSTRQFPSDQLGICITVADTGVGISDQDKLNLFTPFFTTKKSLGTGLGLWITKELLENRGGRVRFRSRTSSPSGTVLSLYIPQASQADVGTIG